MVCLGLGLGIEGALSLSSGPRAPVEQTIVRKEIPPPPKGPVKQGGPLPDPVLRCVGTSGRRRARWTIGLLRSGVPLAV